LGGHYTLPEELRSRLAEPMGQVFRGDEIPGPEFQTLANGSPMVITVGDRVTETLGDTGRTPDVQVVDGVERREKRSPPDVPFARLIRVRNPAGTLTEEAIDGMREAFRGEKPVRVEVEGEEDLMAILAVAMAPVSAMIFYGQPGVGVVAVKVNGVTKSRNRETLAAMGIERLE
jgi:GTP-dependent dephospho-CoA kinase